MKSRVFPLLLPLLLLAGGPAHASPEEAARIQEEHQLRFEAWSLNLRLQEDPLARERVLADRPDPHPFARRMWALIRPSLHQEWTLEPAAWFVRVAAPLTVESDQGVPAQAYAAEIGLIRDAVETHHANHPKVGAVCLALVPTADPRALTLLEKIEAEHPENSVQGVAALGVATMLRALGDEPDIVRRRLDMLRKASLNSGHLEIGGQPLAPLIQEELYVITHLTKGREAPVLSGTDSGGRPMSLDSFRGRAVILLFWGSGTRESERTLDLAAETLRKFAGRPLEVVGVNHDPVEVLRGLQAEGRVTWPTFSDPANRLATQYRVSAWPFAVLLDAKGRIEYMGAPGTFVELATEALLADMAEED